MSGSAATKGVEGDRDALGGSFSPLLHMWCRFCGSTDIMPMTAEILELCCQDCFKGLTETSFTDVMKDITEDFRVASQQIDALGQTLGQNLGQAFAEYAEHLAQRVLPTPDSPLSPYQATQDLTLDALEQAIQALLPDSPSYTVRPAPTGSLRDPSPQAVFHDEIS